MPLFMEVHTINGSVCIEAVAKAHVAKLQIQTGHDVRYLRYWVDEQGGKVFCLVEAPSAAAVATVHRQAHGRGADEIHQVKEGLSRSHAAVRGQRPKIGSGRAPAYGTCRIRSRHRGAILSWPATTTADRGR